MAKSKSKQQRTLKDSLLEIYHDPSSAGSYGGIERLIAEAKRRGLRGITRDKVVKILADEQAYSLHKPVRRKFQRNKTYVSGIDVQWQADLADMQNLAKENNGFKYLLTCIDVFSKYAWAVCVKDKSAKSMVAAFEELFKLSGKRKPKRLQTDKGKEFLCKPVQDLLKSHGIVHFASNSDNKAAVVERFNRTLKSRMWTYFTAQNTKRYIEVLPRFVNSYNASYHRSIGMSPANVRSRHANLIWRRLYGDGSARPNKKKIASGSLVRINRWKGSFEKGYLPNWSKETFHVAKSIRYPQTMYELHDKMGEPIEGNFYGRELQEVKSGEYVVEKILRQRKLPDGSYEVLVKWEGWPAAYNSWVRKDSLTDHA